MQRQGNHKWEIRLENFRSLLNYKSLWLLKNYLFLKWTISKANSMLEVVIFNLMLEIIHIAIFYLSLSVLLILVWIHWWYLHLSKMNLLEAVWRLRQSTGSWRTKLKISDNQRRETPSDDLVTETVLEDLLCWMTCVFCLLFASLLPWILFSRFYLRY